MLIKENIIALLILVMATGVAQGGRFDQRVPMRVTKASTFYVVGYLNGLGSVDMMVDTGSSYTTINQAALEVLKKNGAVTYVKDLEGVMADGTRKIVPVYRISNMSIGDGCELHNVDAAVFPGETRYILGLSALKLAAPFVFSTEPPTLVLSNCVSSLAQSPVAGPGDASMSGLEGLTLNAEQNN